MGVPRKPPSCSNSWHRWPWSESLRGFSFPVLFKWEKKKPVEYLLSCVSFYLISLPQRTARSGNTDCSVLRAPGADTVCDSHPANLPHDRALQGPESGSDQSRRSGLVCPLSDGHGYSKGPLSALGDSVPQPCSLSL